MDSVREVPGAGSRPRRLVLAGAAFVIEDADTWRRSADVIVESNEIVEIRDARPESETPESKVIDCSGLLLMPGLVNAHTHLFQVVTRGIGKTLGVREWAQTTTYPVARELTARDYYVAALLACADAIRNGCTAVVDHPTHFARFHADESCRAISATGLRGAVARGGSDLSLIDRGETRPLEEDLEQTASFLSRWSDEPRLQAWVGPSGFHTCSAQALQAFKRLAANGSTRFHLHLAESAAGRTEARQAGFEGEAQWACELGLVDPMTSFAHAIWISDAEIEMLARGGCQVVHCASSNQLLASGTAPFSAMLMCGIPVALATDGPSSNDSLDMVAEMKAAALLARVTTLQAGAVGPREVLRAATEGGAGVLGYARLGRLAVGQLADIVGLQTRGNPSLSPCNDPLMALVLCASGRDVSFVMVDGTVLYRDGKFEWLNIDDVILEVEAIAKRFRHRWSR
jgi:5-methylthioadenosine/S-adenosylhomocysteine deaminase